MDKPYLIVIGGATASGKSAVAVRLCALLEGEVISCDSMQIYRGMDIGTAKPDMAEREGIPHHLLDIANPTDTFSVAAFREAACRAISDVLSRGRQPVLCGGTGLYIDAVTRPMAFSEQSDPAVRSELIELSGRENGKQILHDMLSRIDPVSAARIHPNDVRRVIRAIEIYRISGRTMTEQMALDSQREGDYRVSLFALDWPRDVLYARIDRRVDQMIERGLADEVKRLLNGGLTSEHTAMQALGYKEIAMALEGRCTLEEAVEAIKTGSRRYAKRQLTWFRRDPRVQWIKADGKSTDEIAEEMRRYIHDTNQ